MADGLMLMAVGMTTVFAFLVLMVLLMKAQAAFFRRFDIEYIPGRSSASLPLPLTQAEPHLHIAIALAAIEAHRRRQSS